MYTLLVTSAETQSAPNHVTTECITSASAVAGVPMFCPGARALPNIYPPHQLGAANADASADPRAAAAARRAGLARMPRRHQGHRHRRQGVP
eukprot:82189-Rhodomonas_salina.1